MLEIGVARAYGAEDDSVVATRMVRAGGPWCGWPRRDEAKPAMHGDNDGRRGRQRRGVVQCDGSGRESRSTDGGEEEDEMVYKRRGPLVPGGATTGD